MHVGHNSPHLQQQENPFYHFPLYPHNCYMHAPSKSTHNYNKPRRSPHPITAHSSSTSRPGWRRSHQQPPPSTSLSTSSSQPPNSQSYLSLQHPKKLLGFSVIHIHTQELVGIVQDILGSEQSQQPHPLLKVALIPTSSSTDDTPYPSSSSSSFTSSPQKEEHLIPLVKSIIPKINPQSQIIYIDPPAGLLDLGRRKASLQQLATELAPYTTSPPKKAGPKLEGVRMMPTRQQLIQAGRQDLVKMVTRAGGFLDVAAQLGFRARRRPPGYWEDEAALEAELAYFVAAHWVVFENPEVSLSRSDDRYWYNQVTHRVTWDEPSMPESVALDSEGSEILVEAEEDRVMPSRSSILAAGRYDLHNAITAAGGYVATGEMLGRRPAWPPSHRLKAWKMLVVELKEAAEAADLPVRTMPTATMLLDQDRGDIVRAVARLGGFGIVAEKLGWRTFRRPRNAWQNIHYVLQELRAFVGEEEDGGGEEVEVVGIKGVEEGMDDDGGDGSSNREKKKKEKKRRMPTHEELRRAGRHDLRFALQQHGSKVLADMLGWEVPYKSNRRERKKGGVCLEQSTAPTR